MPGEIPNTKTLRARIAEMPQSGGDRLRHADMLAGRGSFGSASSHAHILRTLARHDVRFVLEGGAAATLMGLPVPPNDIDVVPDWNSENLERLTAALVDLKLTHWNVPNWPDGVGPAALSDFGPLPPANIEENQIARYSRDDLAVDVFRYATAQEFFFERLDINAVETDVDGTVVKVASLEDLIAVQRAAVAIPDSTPARRAKDFTKLQMLELLAEVRSIATDPGHNLSL